ncbi:hypothetical protein SCAPIOD80026 [Staphylococcus capitis]|nr:hypothetical protein CR01_10026 [Staphylococcus capitis CR01]CQD29890.1 hypothetical protein SCAPIOD80026 [Staphylococcus capitis]CQD30069.1 hypothetical protein SCAPIOD90026 [Staphylococcus capitis]CQD33609.1 hypothetical protein SCAPIOD50136 [Staphylococcus capitis]CRN12067.1 hypothetical protein BN151750134 [Staphylococcus capitis]
MLNDLLFLILPQILINYFFKQSLVLIYALSYHLSLRFYTYYMNINV